VASLSWWLTPLVACLVVACGPEPHRFSGTGSCCTLSTPRFSTIPPTASGAWRPSLASLAASASCMPCKRPARRPPASTHLRCARQPQHQLVGRATRHHEPPPCTTPACPKPQQSEPGPVDPQGMRLLPRRPQDKPAPGGRTDYPTLPQVPPPPRTGWQAGHPMPRGSHRGPVTRADVGPVELGPR